MITCARCHREAEPCKLDETLCADCVLTEMRGMIGISTRVEHGNMTHVTQVKLDGTVAPQRVPGPRPTGRVIKRVK